MSLLDNYKIDVFPIGRGSWGCEILERGVEANSLAILRSKPIPEELFNEVRKIAQAQGSNADALSYYNRSQVYTVISPLTQTNIKLTGVLPYMAAMLRYLKGIDESSPSTDGQLDLVWMTELNSGQILSRKLVREDTRQYQLADVVAKLQSAFDGVVAP